MNHVTADPPRRKRLKVVRACSECRRKKTKCNGDYPCGPCLKTNSPCQYTNSTTKLVQQKQTQPPTDSVSQVTPTATTSLTDKELPTRVSPTSSSASTLETSQSTCDIATKSVLSASHSIHIPTGTSRHDIPNATTKNTRPRSPFRKPMTYTIQAIEHRLLEIEKTLTLLLQRHYPALPALVLSSPSSSSSTSTDVPVTTHTKGTVTTGTVASSHKVSQEDTFGDHHSPRIKLTLPPLQTRPLPHGTPVSSSSDGGLLLPYHDTKSLFDRKTPALQHLLPQHQHQLQLQQQQQQQQQHHHHHHHHHHQESKTGPSVKTPFSPTFHYHSPIHSIAQSHSHLPSCIP
ncbi:hypothetical protein BCR42DRAFT_417689 [Absidia repens]|uniref:Zn(2)-C6 fungal-type domain-containing protein n=1 Tax=Absidia repens TaxID=90262 RepID=A0A1X2IEK0_9FUNG|nr:hypothetical protein BCR42DRAFT_417689 [Absidia repens]